MFGVLFILIPEFLEMSGHFLEHMSSAMRKPAFCICENKGADQLCGNGTADQRLCFHYKVQSLFCLNLKFQASSHLLRPSFCRKSLKTDFLETCLIYLLQAIYLYAKCGSMVGSLFTVKASNPKFDPHVGHICFWRPLSWFNREQGSY